MPANIRVGDHGTGIKITIKDQDGIPVNISTASSLALSIIKPNGVILSKSGEFVTNGTDGQLQYIIVNGDIDVSGIWEISANLVMLGGTYSSDRYEFRVERA